MSNVSKDIPSSKLSFLRMRYLATTTLERATLKVAANSSLLQLRAIKMQYSSSFLVRSEERRVGKEC